MARYVRCEATGAAGGLIEDFDRARLHYVALTWVLRLLVLIASGEQDASFGSIWERATHWSGVDREALGGHRFGTTGAVPGWVVEIGHLKCWCSGWFRQREGTAGLCSIGFRFRLRPMLPLIGVL